ncbi:hypothetical protein WJX79_005754 [Trebouxia sp. C0005]
MNRCVFCRWYSVALGGFWLKGCTLVFCISVTQMYKLHDEGLPAGADMVPPTTDVLACGVDWPQVITDQ